MKYKRILLKLSGGALSGDKDFGFEKESLENITEEIIKAVNSGVEVAVLVGGGNILEEEQQKIGKLKEQKRIILECLQQL